MPPSIEELEKRLVGRGTDSAEAIACRISKATVEIEDAKNFDVIVVNDNLEVAVNQVEKAIKDFLV